MMRPDFRTVHQLRPLACCLGEIGEASGSCAFTQGFTEATASVYGPTQPKYSRHEHYDTASLEIDFSVSGTARTSVSSAGGNSALARLERSAGKFIRQSLLGAVILKDYPRTIIVVKICIVRDDGSMLSAALNAAALALMDAGIAMNYLPNSVTIFVPPVVAGETHSTSSSTASCAVDPSSSEENEATSKFLFVLNPSALSEGSGDGGSSACILQTHATGRDLTPSTTMDAMILARKASKIIQDFARKMIADKAGL